MERSELTNVNQDESFRDSISTVDKSGKRIWLYPKNSKGKLTNYRYLLSLLFIGMMVAGTFIKIDGEPLLLLNIIERKFIIFGKIFWPQDFHIFLLIMIAFVVFIGIFTMVYGRVFCGWICPQTIFMESVFRKIEYWIEGDFKTRVALDKAPLSAEKFFKKLSKHLIFFSISFLIASIFLSYILGVEKVLKIMHENPTNHPGMFTSHLVFSFAFYWVFSRIREQVCTTICPYGRLQGVLLDKNSLIVAYDYVKGEKRGKLKAKESRKEAGKGDCIDCNQCVNVCPMGIDIRNGTQMECTNCTACIDACNFMMRSVGLAEGLIRMDSEAGIAESKPFKVTTRIAVYTGVLLVLIGFIFILLLMRTDIETSILRTPGVSYQELPDNKVSNLYNIKMINKTSKEIQVKIKVLSDDGEIKLVGKEPIIPSQGTAETAAFIVLDKADIKKAKTKIKIGVYSDGKELETLTTSFIGPLN
ncbi:cytochrome c oxidase accessory protein CcoG [Sporocytophaga myxococcoides]|uniref:cytochrome c oxidase accessory protein CcoG n=1 Tax=Sporocytophaga myxococcoides TaxID=153721 RepID=UPI0003F7280C|nr:cytochrome c oxidase accessory protein CcoG [Sporocytophaga myxococcoides]